MMQLLLKRNGKWSICKSGKEGTHRPNPDLNWDPQLIREMLFHFSYQNRRMSRSVLWCHCLTTHLLLNIARPTNYFHSHGTIVSPLCILHGPSLDTFHWTFFNFTFANVSFTNSFQIKSLPFLQQLLLSVILLQYGNRLLFGQGCP